MNWEVRTMPSGKSPSESAAAVRRCRFYPTLFFKNVKRFWPLWTIYLVFWLFALPLSLLLYGRFASSIHTVEGMGRYVLTTLSGPGVVAALVGGLVCAMAVFSYLYNARAVSLFHSLPVTRCGLFWTSWLSGLAFLLVPNVLVFLLTLAVEAAAGTVALWATVLWLLSLSLMELFFYSFAALCAMFTGHLAALPVFYGIFNCLVAGVTFLVVELARQMVFGFVTPPAFVSDLASWLTPVLQLSRQVYPTPSGAIAQGAGPLQGFFYILVYALVGMAFTILALVLYRRRQLERSGDIVAVSWARPVFKYGVAVCVALALGTLLYAFFLGALPSSIWSLLLFLVPSGLIGYFAAEMILRKSFRVFRRGWKGACVLTAILVAVCAFLDLDPTGYETRVPELSEIKSVTFSGGATAPYDGASGSNITFTEAEEIAWVTGLHTSIVERIDQLEGDTGAYISVDSGEPWPEEIYYETESSTWVELEYHLKSGEMVLRNYRIPVGDDYFADPDSPASHYSEMMNDPAVVERLYFGNLPEGARITEVTISNQYSVSGGWLDQGWWSLADLGHFSQADAEMLLAAVEEDIAAGRLGRRYLLDSREKLENCYVNNLNFYFQTVSADGSGQNAAAVYDVYFTLQTTATSTIAALEELGLIDEAHPLLTAVELCELEQAVAQQGEAALPGNR